MNKYIAPILAVSIISINFIYSGDLAFTVIHLISFFALTIVLLIVTLLIYALINMVRDSFRKTRLGLESFAVVGSVIVVVVAVVATPSLCFPIGFRMLMSSFEDGMLNDVPVEIELVETDMDVKDFFLVDGFKFNIPNDKIYARETSPFRIVQLSENNRNRIIVTQSTNEELGEVLLSEIKTYIYSGHIPFYDGDKVIEAFNKLANKANYDIYKSIAMVSTDDFKIGSSMEEIIYTYEMLLIKYLTLPGNPEREMYSFESEAYSALMFGSRVDFFKDNRNVTLVFDDDVPTDERMYIFTHAIFDELVLSDDYIPTNIPAKYNEVEDTTIYEYTTIENEEIPAGSLVFNNSIGIEPGNKLSMKVNIGVSEEENVIIDQIIFNVDNEYDEIRVRNKALNIITDKENAKVTKALFCGNYEEFTDELVTKDLEFFKEIVNSRNVEIKFVAEGYSKVHEVSDNEKAELEEFILLYELLLSGM